MQPGLAIFGALLGQCWSAEVAPQTLDTHCFTDMWSGSHVRDRHSVTKDGKSIYDGETIYSFDGKAIVFTYVNSMAGVGKGTAEAGDHAIRFTGSMRASPGAPAQPMNSTWRLIEGGFDVLAAGAETPVRFRRAR